MAITGLSVDSLLDVCRAMSVEEDYIQQSADMGKESVDMHIIKKRICIPVRKKKCPCRSGNSGNYRRTWISGRIFFVLHGSCSSLAGYAWLYLPAAHTQKSLQHGITLPAAISQIPKATISPWEKNPRELWYNVNINANADFVRIHWLLAGRCILQRSMRWVIQKPEICSKHSI